jgi:tripartite-type tricarboxylate transporter receptor subunit TctC
MISIVFRHAVVAALAALPAFAQKVDCPTKPVRFIVPFPPGGTVDHLARLVGARLSATLGQPLIVDVLGGNIRAGWRDLTVHIVVK